MFVPWEGSAIIACLLTMFFSKSVWKPGCSLTPITFIAVWITSGLKGGEVSRVSTKLSFLCFTFVWMLKSKTHIYNHLTRTFVWVDSEVECFLALLNRGGRGEYLGQQSLKVGRGLKFFIACFLPTGLSWVKLSLLLLTNVFRSLASVSYTQYQWFFIITSG